MAAPGPEPVAAPAVRSLGPGAAGIVLAVGLAAGLAAGLLPFSGLAILALPLLGTLVILVEVAAGHRLFWAVLVGVLVGYACLGKGFAYLGVGPLFVGEIALGVGVSSVIVAVVLGRWRPGSVRWRVEHLALALFLGWQAARTLAFVPSYGIDAVRDGALWGYAAFALCIMVLVPRRAVDAFVEGYGRFLLPFLIWAAATLTIQKLGLRIPALPGTTVPLLWSKAGDIGVHLGGIGAFLLTSPAGRETEAKRSSAWWPWIAWWVTWLTIAATGRAGALAALVGTLVAAVLAFNYRVIRFAAAAVVVSGMLAVSGVRLPFRGGELSFSYIATSIGSTVGQQRGVDGGPDLQTTKAWRLDWWRKVVSYTVQGEHFWLGKGYGVNLAFDDGVRGPGSPLRSPHNATMTILARSGVPGLLLWVAFLAALAWRLASYLWRSGASPADRRFAAWALAYLAAFLVNASFDVYLEGPMGGIWFWTIVGICLVKTREAASPTARPTVTE